MIVKQCDRCKSPVELNQASEPPGFICSMCFDLWKIEEAKLEGKIYVDELPGKFKEFIASGETLQNITSK